MVNWASLPGRRWLFYIIFEDQASMGIAARGDDLLTMIFSLTARMEIAKISVLKQLHVIATGKLVSWPAPCDNDFIYGFGYMRSELSLNSEKYFNELIYWNR